MHAQSRYRSKTTSFSPILHFEGTWEIDGRNLIIKGNFNYNGSTYEHNLDYRIGELTEHVVSYIHENKEYDREFKIAPYQSKSLISDDDQIVLTSIISIKSSPYGFSHYSCVAERSISMTIKNEMKKRGLLTASIEEHPPNYIDILNTQVTNENQAYVELLHNTKRTLNHYAFLFENISLGENSFWFLDNIVHLQKGKVKVKDEFTPFDWEEYKATGK